MTKNLVFFNKKGDPLNLKYDEANDKWGGIIHFDEISIGLFESDTIYILEKLKDGNTGDIVYGHPRINPLTDINENVVFNLSDEKDESFKFFTVDNPYLDNPIIKITKDPISSNFIKDNTDVYDGIDDIIVTNNNVSTAMRVDIAINNEDYGVFTNNIVMANEVGEIFNIELYGEIIGEDERLPILLSNMGEMLNHEDEFIFRSSDINEDSPNYKILNQKRKELLLELHNIKPYSSSYRGIINMIKFFGYFDLTLKEYWYDPYTERYNFEDVKLYETEKLSDPNNNMHKFKKTSLFGLFYDINSVVDGEYDEMGLPVTKNNFIFSNEEVLIKLFGLKNYLKHHDIGGTAEIIDIVGEMTYFNKFSFNFWIDESKEFVIDQHIQPIFESDITDGNIRDIRDITNDFTSCLLDRKMDKTDKFYHPCFIGYFEPYYMDNPDNLDQPGIDVGMPIKLTNRTFDHPWKNFGMTWNDTIRSEVLPTWKTISFMNHYEVEWVVEKITTENDSRKWKWTKRGKILETKEVDVILPYDGSYSVTIIIYGYNNINSRYTKKSYINVGLKNADLSVFFKYIDKDLQRWGSNDLKWGDVFSEWKNPIYDNKEFVMSEDDTQMRSFHVANYEFIDGLNIQDATIESPTWNELFNVSWKDYAYVTWGNLVPDRERLARFIIDKIKNNGKLQIGKDEYIFPEDLNVEDFGRLANLLEQQTGVDISTFQYTPRIRNNKKYIDAVSKDHGSTGNKYVGASNGANVLSEIEFSKWSEAKKTKWSNVPIKWSNSSKIAAAVAHQNPFTWDNTKSYNSRFDVPTMIPIYMNINNSKMAGKTKVKWSIMDNDRDYTIIDSIESLYFVYTFRQEGIYTIKAEIIDTNGNTNTVIKNKMVRVYKTDRYRLLRKINKE